MDEPLLSLDIGSIIDAVNHSATRYLGVNKVLPKEHGDKRIKNKIPYLKSP